MKKSLKCINDELPQVIDLFICSSSFEERCFAIVDQIESKRIQKAVVCSNFDQDDIVGNNFNKLIEKFDCEVLETKFDTNDPLSIADELVNSLNDLKNSSEKNIVIDVTTFTHEGLLILLKVFHLNDISDKNDVILLYNSAEQYCHDTDNIEDVWLSKGLRDKRTVLGYPGRFNPTNSLHLLLLVGFEIERAKHLIEAYEPDLLSLGISDEKESVASDIHEINKRKYNDLSIVYNDVTEFTFSCIDPAKTFTFLKQHVEKFPHFNFVLSPMNNKISTIGCALLAFVKPEVQIICSRANIYNTTCYSKPSEYFYKFNLRELLSGIRI